MTSRDVLAGLDDEQRAVATAVTGPVVVLAGAGTGKTRAITHRIAHVVATGAQDAEHGLAVTFTNRAAGEMRARLSALDVSGVQVRTFHAAALRQLRYFWPRLTNGGAFPQLLDRKARLVAEAAARCGQPNDAAFVRDLAAEIEWAKSTGVAASDYARAATDRTPPGDARASDVAAVYLAYEDLRTDRDLLDFEDVLLLTVGMLADYPDVAASVRSQYRWFTVDEFQDVNPMQARLLDLWLGDREEVCVVGDVGQTIYTFTGASADHLIEFARRHPTATQVKLVRSYRCSPEIVELANKVLDRGSGAAAKLRVELRSENPSGPEPRIRTYDDEPAEAAAVAARASELIASGIPARDIAVLYRTNAQSEVYEAAFSSAGVPVVVRGGERFFDRPEVRTGITLIRGAAKAPDGSPLGVAVRDVLAAAGWTPQPPGGVGAVRERWESQAALAALADELAAADPEAGLADLVVELDRRSELQHAPQVDGVTLASLHAAKGLEWTAVFLVGLADGMLPIVYADTPERVEEERRLLYVGITRARTHLELSWARSRTPGGRASRSVSPFVSELTSVPPAPQATRKRSVARCRGCGKSLVTAIEVGLGRCSTCPAELDLDLFERLRSWRLERARAQGVPAYVVFTDRTLQALAELAPGNEQELAQIAGIGPAKLSLYGRELLALVAGASPESALQLPD